MNKFYAVFVLVLMTGCFRVGPDFTTPIVDTQESWLEQSHVTTEEMEVGPWWHNYHDELLNCLVDYALEVNFSLEAAGYRILAARANLGIAIGEYFPQTQQLEGSAFRTHLSANAPNTINASRDFWDNILGLRVAWELDFWGRFTRGVQAAFGEYVATQDDYQDVQRILVSDLVFAFVQQKTVQARMMTLERNIAAQYRSVEIAKVRWQEGYDSELDYAQAVALWKETEAQRVNLEIELKRAETTIAILVGLTPEEFSWRYQITPEPLTSPMHATVSFPVQILCQRPDLRRSIDLLFSQSARIGIAVSDLYPRISFSGFLGLECASDTKSTANQNGKHFFSRSSLTFLYGPNFVWPILNYGRLENRVKEQYAILDEGIALYRNQVLEAYKEVEDALTFFAKSIEEASSLEESFKHAKRSVDISTLQYQEGIADYSRVLNSLQLQVEIEDKLALVEGNVGLGYALIFKALGNPVSGYCGDQSQNPCE